jgi:fibronectin type 3 domain-containing protein
MGIIIHSYKFFKNNFYNVFHIYKVTLQGKVSYFSMPFDVLENSKNLEPEIITCTYEWSFLIVVTLF